MINEFKRLPLFVYICIICEQCDLTWEDQVQLEYLSLFFEIGLNLTLSHLVSGLFTILDPSGRGHLEQ